MAYIPLFTCIVSFIFAITVLDQYFARRKPYQLLWSIGLFTYSIAAFTEFCAGVFGITSIILRLWYFIGAILVAAYMGMGDAISSDSTPERAHNNGNTWYSNHIRGCPRLYSRY